MLRYLLLSAMFCTVAAFSAPAAIYYVTPTGSDTSSGTSWSKAFATLEKALGSAAVRKDQVWVKAGTYKLSAPLHLREAINVHGGFRGTEASLSDRPATVVGEQGIASTTATILDGNNVTQVLWQETSFDSVTTWSGFTITKGLCEENGGGVFLKANSILESCNIVGNKSLQSGGGVLFERGGELVRCYVGGNTASINGGGVYSYHGKITESTISRNSAGHGGGVYSIQETAIATTAITENTASHHGGGIYSNALDVYSSCTIRSNTATENGGGAYGIKTATFNRCTLNINKATLGGGAFLKQESQLNACTIANNEATTHGGGAYLLSGGSVDSCTIYQNSARQDGGGLYFDGGGIANRCTISENSAVNNSGGGVYSERNGQIDSCTISFNNARNGGGVCCNYSTRVTWCTLNSNEAVQNGGGVICNNDSSFIFQCRIYNNSTQSSGGGIFADKNTSIVGCAITNNAAAINGGGAYCSSTTSILSCTLACNSAALYGGGVYISNNSTMTNSIIWGNNTSQPAYTAIDAGKNAVTYCAIDSVLVSGTGNFLIDPSNVGANAPSFEEPCTFFGVDVTLDQSNNKAATADWRINRRLSFCVNAGDNSAIPSFYFQDLNGRQRIYDGAVDVGAYEYGSIFITGVDPSPYSLLGSATVYPNPASTYLYVALPDNAGSTGSEVRVQVVSGQGTVLMEESFYGAGAALNISAAPKGLLFVRLLSNGKSVTKKILKN
ncbi:MAG: T9SS type A sorting domain-containing protein [Prevotellaceae bacterium]|jgi:predicted outer membrane repeat protein|nr:T9SS type A sorting domain-containing protein [Prevotellaceae bacterium]